MEVKTCGWYAVRCVFADHLSSATMYEERITLWRAASAEEAIARAEAEASEYAAGHGKIRASIYTGLAQCYALAEEPTDGGEVFSLLRDSDLEPDEYLDTFFDTGSERQSVVE